MMRTPNPDCLRRNEPHARHQLAGPGGGKPGSWCDGLEHSEALVCGTPDPGESVDAMLERRQADGSITIGDADTVRDFRDFLREMGLAKASGDASRRRAVLIKYADFCGFSEADVEVLKAAQDRASAQTPGPVTARPAVGFICPECAANKCVNCNGQAFDSANDLIVDCTCPHERTT